MQRVLEFTYNFDLVTSSRDRTRWYVGDTDRTRPLVDDREVEFTLLQVGDEAILAAIIILKVLANKFAREADITVGDVSRSLSKLSDAFRLRAVEFEGDLTTRALPFFGGRSISGKQALALDTNAVQPHFTMGQTDSYRAVQIDAMDQLAGIGYWAW